MKFYFILIFLTVIFISGCAVKKPSADDYNLFLTGSDISSNGIDIRGDYKKHEYAVKISFIGGMELLEYTLNNDNTSNNVFNSMTFIFHYPASYKGESGNAVENSFNKGLTNNNIIISNRQKIFNYGDAVYLKELYRNDIAVGYVLTAALSNSVAEYVIIGTNKISGTFWDNAVLPKIKALEGHRF